ncbi:protein sma d; protein sma c; protein sma b [Trichuris trichiura]|uniref:Protein sma d protein sma c protein sma b n=1 Tax=Trichuris trichiura TaxID=36087 RepID=A0A077YX40_TRITR|nr:protein sma d; protein sma c; protein sma b [Trichuris trichiura]
MYSPYRSASAVRHDSPTTMNGSPIPLVKSGSEDLDSMDPTVYFERGRIKQLQDERVSIQKKTFTKWCNSYLNRAHLEIIDLFTDLCDGILLLKLLEIISGDKLGKANRGRMRVHKIENLNRVLEYLKRKRIQLENIGAEDILDANPRLILGLIWTIILRFQIEDIEIEVDENESSEKKFAKDALLLWCQRKTAGYPCVKIENFTTSWRSGLGFNALIHAHRPDLINFNELSPNDHTANLNNAFEVAEKKLGIARLLDAEDIDVARPDEKSVITYVSMYYHYFAKQKSELTGAKRIAKVIWQLMNTDQMKQEYELVASELLQWIREKVEELSDRRFPNSLKGIQDEMIKFKLYRTQEKPAKYKEKGELEVLVFNIRTKQKALGTKQYVPPNGLLLHDIETAWNTLESAEHNRQVALHEELIRQERLEQLARNFERKAKLRESWLHEMTLILQDFEFGRTVSQVEANVKKHEAISADILPRENRFQGLKSMANELARENYHNRAVVRAREQNIWEKWLGLLKVLDSRRAALISLNKLMNILRDVDALSQEFEQIEASLKSRDSGKHLLAVEDLLQKHDLLETQLMAHGKWLKGIVTEAQAYIRAKGLEFEILQSKVGDLQQHYESLLTWAKNRRAGLEQTRELYQFMQDSEEEGAWLKEKSRLCVNLINQTDPSALSQVHLFLKVTLGRWLSFVEGLETEMQGHWLRTKQVLAVGEKQLLNTPTGLRKDLQTRLNQLHVRWEELRQLVVVLNEYVKEAQQILQFYQDANEAESWIAEKMPLVTSQDVGKDETSAESLLVRHGHLEGEIKAYKEDINPIPKSPRGMTADATDVSRRQQEISARYRELISQAKTRRELLEDTIQSHRFYRECYEFETWAKLVEKALNEPIPPEDMDPRRRRFNNIVADINGSGAMRLKLINQMAEDFIASGHSQADRIKARQRQISDRWQALIKLKERKAADLDAAEGVAQFTEMCRETRTWILEKTSVLEEETEAKDLKGLQTLQRKHQNLERELRPVEDKMKSLKCLADQVVKAYPVQSASIRTELNGLNDMWLRLKQRVNERRKALEDSQGLQMFQNVVEDLMAWMNKVKMIMTLIEKPVDVTEAEMMIERHCEVHSDIMAHKEELNYANELGKRLLSKGQKQAEVEKALQALEENSSQVVTMWQNKRKILGEMLDLQLFIREADHIDAATKGHEAFLEITDVGDSVDAVEDLLKQHYQFENKLCAQNERVTNFTLMSESLLAHHHPESALIKQREKDVTKYRQAIVDKAAVRRKALEDSLVFHQFKRNADELLVWVGEKMRIAVDDSYHSGLNLQRRLKKHEAFEAELRANEDRLNRLNKQGDELCQAKSVKSDEVEATLRRLNREWKLLLDHSAARGLRLQQAWEQRALNRILDDANVKLIEIQKELQSDDIGVDLRAIKQLIQKHSVKSYNNTMRTQITDKLVLEQDVTIYAKKVKAIVDQALQLANNGHYDAKRMLTSVQELNEKFMALREPMELKRSKLDRSLMLHQFNFDVECERQWIREKMPMASFQEYGRSLTDAVNLRKKHEVLGAIFTPIPFGRYADFMTITHTPSRVTSLVIFFLPFKQLESEVNGHQPVVDRVVAGGRQLVSMHHFASDDIKQKCAILEEEWLALKLACSARKQKLAVAFLGHQFYAEAAEVESWMGEKRLFLSSRDIGADENSANVLLARHKALQDEMKTYKNILESLNAQCNKLKEMNHADVKQIHAKQQELVGQFKELEELAEKRIRVLSEAVSLYEYLRESQDLEQWISEQQVTASSEECGRDYEHLIELMTKFNDFKQRVRTGFERFAMCEASAQALLEKRPPFARDVVERRQRLAAAWSALLDCIQARDQHLHDAEEIHRFNRDCSDAMSRIMEKSEAIPRDLGKDMVAVKSLLRRHDAFENELVALEAQLQVIVDDSARLQDLYPGTDSEHIARREREVIESWNRLQEKVVGRRGRLSASYDLQFFMAKARDFIQWTQDVIADLRSAQPVRDLQSAELLDASHRQLHAEIEARAESKRGLQEMATMMCSQKHYAEKEINEKIAQVNAAHDEVLNEWERGNVWIGQLILLHTFLREAKQIVGQLNRCGVSLNSEIPDSVEGVNLLMRKQEMFEKKLNVLEDRVLNLKNEADKLLQRKHPESKNIQRTYSDTEKRWRHLLQRNDERKAALKDALLYANFKSDIAEVESWIDDRFKSLTTMTDEQNVKNISLQEKMKRLQKHQTIEAELVTHEQRIRQINQNANALLKQGHVSREEVVQLRDMIYAKWTALGKACQEQSRALEEARDILLFEQMIDRISSWMRATELMVNSGDMAEDFEHCIALLKKLSDAEVEASVDDETLKKITTIGEKLVSTGRTDKEDLEAAKEVHAFRRDVNDTLERIAEKFSLVTAEEQVRDLPSVELLFRNQENVERDMTVIGEKIETHRRDAAVLLPKEPPLKQLVVEGLQQLDTNWVRLKRAAAARKTRLQAAHELLKFFDCTRELESWSSNMMSKLTSYNMPHTVHESQCQLEAHKERKAEILGRREQFQQHEELGSQLKSNQSQQAKAIAESMDKLKRQYADLLKVELLEKWDEENARLWRWYEFQYFSEQACQVDSWLATKEAFLNRDNPGNSLDEVDKLLKQQDRFETTLRAQSEKMDKLTSAADKLSKEDPENVDQIVHCRDAAANRYDRVLRKCDMRRALLNDSRKWHLFLKTCHDMMNWINQKLQIAYDESYLDSTNLQNKLRKHGAFDAELKANDPRVAAIEKQAEALIAADHFAKNDIALQVKEITEGWEELKKASSLKSERLEDAFSAYQFSRRVNDLDKWIDNVESQLSSDDHGTDLFSVENLLKRHELLEEEIAARKVDFDEIDDTAKKFISRQHFLAGEIEEKATAISERYASLREPCEIRKENLTDAHRLYQWLHAADEQSAWFREHRPIVFNEYLVLVFFLMKYVHLPKMATALGESLQSAQNLLKKHQLVEQNLAANEDTFKAMRLAGERMVSSGHFAASVVQQRLQELGKELDSFRDQATIRRLKLFDAIEVQQYFCDAFEAEEWIRGRQAVLSSEDVGQDEEVVLGALKKLEQIEQDVANYKSELDRLSNSARAMLDRHHFDEVQIAAKQSQLERDYNSLMSFCQDRRQRLTDARRYYQYIRQADNLTSWLREKEAAAMSEDYGRDLEHCQVLITNFEQFLRELSAAGERVASVQRVQDDLLRSNHPFSASIKAKGADLQKLWCDVNEAATDRQQALLGALQVHKFDQEADETLNWLQEKEAQIVSESDDVGQSDLMTIQAQLQRNDIFMVSWQWRHIKAPSLSAFCLQRELSAVERQVETLCKEAERLVSLYPDTQKHLDVRKQEMLDVLADVKHEGNRRLQKLKQAEELQTYFDDYHDLMNWINEMHTTITSEGLARDVVGAEAQVVAHKEHFAEIEARKSIVQNFVKLGREMMRAKHLLSNEISGKVECLEASFDRLLLVWEERNSLYAMNLDAQLWKRDAAALEVWLGEREALLEDDWRRVESVSAVEEKIRQFDDFMTTLSAQDDKFEALKKLTLLEQAFKNQIKREDDMRRQEEVTREKMRKDKIKTLEKHKILQVAHFQHFVDFQCLPISLFKERRQERERRRTQEITLMGTSLNDADRSATDTSAIKRRSSIASPPSVLRYEGATLDSSRQVAAASSDDGSRTKLTMSIVSTEDVTDADISQPLEPSEARRKRFSLDSSGLDSSGRLSSGYSASPADHTIHRRRSCDSESSDAMSKRLVAKKTPTFTTRRAAGYRRVLTVVMDMMQSIEKDGYIERKQDLQSGGKKATIRSWKSYYTILCGQLICFFKDQDNFYENMAAAPPINILRAVCQPAFDYQKRKNTFKLRTSDGAEFLFACPSPIEMEDWIAKISFHAALPPSLQLKSFNERHSMIEDNADGRFKVPLAPYVVDQPMKGSQQRMDSGYGTPFHAATHFSPSSLADSETLRMEKIRPVITSSPTSGSLGVIQEEIDDNALCLKKGGRSEVVRKASVDEVDIREQGEPQDELSRLEQFNAMMRSQAQQLDMSSSSTFEPDSTESGLLRRSSELASSASMDSEERRRRRLPRISNLFKGKKRDSFQL